MKYLFCLLSLSLLGSVFAQEKNDSIPIDLGIIVNSEGKVIESNGQKVKHKYNELYFVENGPGRFIVLNPDGKKIMKLKKVMHIDHRSAGVYRVLFESETTGILHPTSGEWIIAPKIYADAFPLSRKSHPYSVHLKPSGYYAVNDSKEVSSWYVIDDGRAVVFDNPIDYPLVELTDFTIVRDNDKYGLVNSVLELIKPIKYDWIHFESGVYFILKDRKWSFFSKEYGTSKHSFDQISTKRLDKGFVVFQKDNIAYVDFQGEYLIPPVSKEVFVREYSLKDLSSDTLSLSSEVIKRTYGRLGAIYQDTTQQVFELATMKNVLKSLEEQTTENEQMYFENGKMGKFHTRGPKARNWLSFPRINRDNIRTKYSVVNLFVSKNYYSKREELLRYTSSVITPEVSYSNYRVQGDSLVSLELTDLFKPAPQQVKILERIIVNEIGRMERNGTEFHYEERLTESRIDLNIAKLMNSFSLSSTGIWFHGQGIISESLFVEYEKFLNHLELVKPIE